MSIQAMTAVWNNSRHKGNKLILLLAIADYANDQAVAWPAIETLAAKTRMSERNVHYLLKELTEDDDPELILEPNAGPHRCNLYCLNLQGAKFAGCNTASKRVQNPAKRVQPVAPNPSLEPSIEPSGIAANAAAPLEPANPSKKRTTSRQTPIQPEAVIVPPPPVSPEQAAADLNAWDALEAAPPEARGRTSDTSTDPEALAVAIAAECGLDMRIKRQKKAALSAAQEISKAGATVGQVKNEFHTHWRQNVYRGMCGELATTYHLVNEWGRWEHITAAPTKPGAPVKTPIDYDQALADAEARAARQRELYDTPSPFPTVIPAWQVLSQPRKTA